MGVNKVVYGGETLIDITDSTVTQETLGDGAVAYGADGERIVGTMTGGVPIDVYEDGDGNIVVTGSVGTDDNGNVVVGGGSGEAPYELVAEWHESVCIGTETTFKEITPTTTAQTILPVATNFAVLEFEPVDMDEYDIFVATSATVEYKYTEDTVLPRPLVSRYVYVSNMSRVGYYDDANGSIMQYGRAYPYNVGSGVTYYLNTSGAFTNASNSNYGITFSGYSQNINRTKTSPDATTSASNLGNRYLYCVELSRSAISVRASATVCSVDAYATMDVDNMYQVGDIYIFKRKRSAPNICRTVGESRWLLIDVKEVLLNA